MRSRNDVAGLLYGDRLSLPITKLMVDTRLSPSWATIGFFVAGVAGSVLQVANGNLAIAGAALLVLYYVLDCVDGEVARWQDVCDSRWAYADFLFHLIVKPLCFLGVGIGLWRELGHTEFLFASFAAAIATLWLKVFLEMPGIVFLKEFLRRAQSSESISARLRPLYERARVLAPRGSNPSFAEPFKLKLDLVTVRALGTNFDVGLLLLLAATVGDLWLEPVALPVLGEVTLRGVWLAYYAVVLPLDFLDYVVTYLRRGHFSQEVSRLLALAHHFTLEPRPQERTEPDTSSPRASNR